MAGDRLRGTLLALLVAACSGSSGTTNVCGYVFRGKAPDPPASTEGMGWLVWLVDTEERVASGELDLEYVSEHRGPEWC